MPKSYIDLDIGMPTFGFRSRRDHGYVSGYLIPVDFDPWTGKWINGEVYKDFLDFVKSRRQKRGFKITEKKEMTKYERKTYAKKRKMHITSFVCDDLEYMISGYEKDLTTFAYIPTIRAFVIFRKGKRGKFDALDYCPFCGAKLPERLDEKLTEILQNEYGLQSWRDYKKAPHEFHTDEWWKKRGL